MFSYHNKQVLK